MITLTDGGMAVPPRCSPGCNHVGSRLAAANQASVRLPRPGIRKERSGNAIAEGIGPASMDRPHRAPGRFRPVLQSFNRQVHSARVIAQMLYVTEFFKKVTRNRHRTVRGERDQGARPQSEIRQLAPADHPPVHRESPNLHWTDKA